MNKLSIIKIVFASLLLWVSSYTVIAQNVTVEASIDSMQILIGEQTKVKLEVSFDAHQKMCYPSCKILWYAESRS